MRVKKFLLPIIVMGLVIMSSAIVAVMSSSVTRYKNFNNEISQDVNGALSSDGVVENDDGTLGFSPELNDNEQGNSLLGDNGQSAITDDENDSLPSDDDIENEEGPSAKAATITLSSTSVSRTYGDTGTNVITASPSAAGKWSISTQRVNAKLSTTTATVRRKMKISITGVTTAPYTTGSVTVYLTPTGGTRVSAKITVNISKAANTVTVSGKTTLTYNGSAQNLLSISSQQGAIYTAIGTQLTSSNYSSSGTNGNISRTDAGSYTVYWYCVGNDNYKAKSGSTTARINKATPTITVSMSGYTYAGTKSTPSVSGNSGSGTVTYYYNTSNSNSGGSAWSYVTSSTYLDVGTYYMYATVASTTNYNSATSATKSFTVSAATMTVTATAYSGTYNGSAQGYAKIKVSVASATVSYGTSTSYGSSLTASSANTNYNMTAVTRTGTGTTTVYYKVTKTNYTTVTGSTTITINNASLSGSVKITGINVQGETLSASVTNTNSATLTYQWYRGSTAISGATSSTYTLTSSDLNNTMKVIVSASKSNYNSTSWNDTTDASNNRYATCGVKLSIYHGSYYGAPKHATDLEIPTVFSSTFTCSSKTIALGDTTTITHEYSTSWVVSVTIERSNTSYNYTLHQNSSGWINSEILTLPGHVRVM